ncbi:hypothetical protein J437_LFUL014017 [Ladona fulva]|uniref:G-protein coupled receptors family 1 profile domain-containing protein n=1 Tax=Ladona fulva TaxID=123851 RepID=A0A8K0KGA8_LADFU|nr:hypothetical protein J437_LFUL014017 [Ladona fulva]
MDSRGDSNDTEVSSIRSVFFNTTPHTLATAVREVSRQQSEEMSGDVATSMLPEDPSSATFWEDRFRRRDPLYIVIPITIVYGLIFFTGLVGNVSTCIVIAKNKHMHTATNYYLFNLAISDLLLLLSGLPAEMYGTWSPTPYVFGEAFCVIQSFAAETSANATVLTITAFTVERYVAICHPLRSHTLSGLSRAVKLVVATWLLAVFLAVPQVFQFGIVHYRDRDGDPIKETAQCMMKHEYAKHAFAISTCVFFVAPMSVITVLYVLIGLRLRRSRMMTRRASGGSMRSEERRQGWRSSQNHVIRMLGEFAFIAETDFVHV